MEFPQCHRRSGLERLGDGVVVVDEEKRVDIRCLGFYWVSHLGVASYYLFVKESPEILQSQTYAWACLGLARDFLVVPNEVFSLAPLLHGCYSW